MRDHIQDGELLRALDGELSGDRLAVVDEHLAACWTCRTRMHDLEGTIHEFVRSHFEEFKDEIPDIDGPRALLRARLQVVASQSQRNFWSGAVHAMTAWRVPAFAVSFAVLALVVFFANYQRLARHDEVAELLHRAEAGEKVGLESKLQPVTYQKLRIEIGGRRYERSVYLDKKGSRSVVHLSAVEARKESGENASRDLAQLQHAFAQSGLDWTEPFSATRMAGWRAALRVRAEHVERGPQLTELTTSTPEGPIAEAQVRFRNEDFHAVSETLRLRNSDVVEIAELDYRVFELAELRNGFFDQPAGNVSPSIAIPVLSSVPGPSMGLELNVVHHLDGVNAFLGEQIAIERGEGELVVRGVVDDAARMREILKALGQDASNPALKVAIVTPTAVAGRSESEPSVSVESIDTLQKAPADEKLRAFLAAKAGTSGSVDEAAQRFAADVSMHSQSARSHALALRQIAQLFTPEDLRAMTFVEHRRWRSMLQAHANAVLAETRAMRENLEPIFRTNVEDKRPLLSDIASDADLVYAAAKLADLAAANDSAVWDSFVASTQANKVTLVCLPTFWDSLLDAEVLAREISVDIAEQEHQHPLVTPVASANSK
jgi:hypothetical protein